MNLKALGTSALNSFNELYRGDSSTNIEDFENWHRTTPGVLQPKHCSKCTNRNYYIKTISKSIYQIGFFSYGVSLLFIALSVLIYAQSRIFSNNDIQVELNKNLNLMDSYDNADLNKEETTIAYDSTFQENNDSFNINDLKNIFSKYSYAVENVRIEKKVPDIIISKLPIDFSLIESTNEKKNLFIQSILPLIIKENNKIEF